MRLGQTGESSQELSLPSSLPDEFELPSAHAEGRLVTRPGDAEKYLASGNVALQYVDNRDAANAVSPASRIPPGAPWV